MPSAALRDRVQSGSEASTTTQAVVTSLKQRFPCREQVIDLLVKVFLPEEEDREGGKQGCFLVHGPPAGGKTAVVRSLLRELGLRHAYVNCNEATRVRTVLCSLLHQLKGGKRQRDEGYASGVKCDSIAEFQLQLPGVACRHGHTTPCWLVLDNAHRLAGSDLLSALMRVQDNTSADVYVLMISLGGWGTGQYLRETVSTLPPKEIRFRGYRPEQLIKILEQRRALAEGGIPGDAPAYRQFLNAFVPSFCRVSNNLLDVQAAVCQLFPLYMQPLAEGQGLQAAALYHRIAPQVQQCMQLVLQRRAATATAHQLAAARGGGEPGPSAAAAAAEQQHTVAARKASSTGLTFELPYISKFLLLAAYVASRNKATADRAVFDPTYHKQGRRDAQAHDRQVEAAVEAKLRGPHSFPLERLLHIFYALYAHHDADDDDLEEQAGLEAQQEAQHVMQQGEVLCQVSSLVALRLLGHASGDVLEGQVFHCHLSDDMAAALAANVRLRLTDYIKLA